MHYVRKLGEGFTKQVSWALRIEWRGVDGHGKHSWDHLDDS